MAGIGSAPDKSSFPPFMLSLPMLEMVEKGEVYMNDLTVKTVDLFGDKVVAAQDKDGVIWAGVKWFCNGLGFSDGQRQRQTTNIGEDIVLSKGVANLHLPTSGGYQDVLCLKLDFLPLWLAKISITPNMKENNPELVDKLVKYQLQAKDILAAAFIPAFRKRSAIEELQELQGRAILEVNEKVDSVEKRVDYLENDIPLYGSEADELSRKVKKKGVEVLGGRESNSYNDSKLRSEVYSDIYNQIKREFGLYDSNGKFVTYKALKRRYIKEAHVLIDGYTPPKYLEEKIKNCNAQQRFVE